MSVTVMAVLVTGLFRLGCLAAGVAFLYFGYRLFFIQARRVPPSEVEARGAWFALRLLNNPPGVIFALLGMIVLGAAIWRDESLTRTLPVESSVRQAITKAADCKELSESDKQALHKFLAEL